MKPPEPIAEICDAWELRYAGSEAIAPLVRRNNLKVGDKLYGPQVAVRLERMERMFHDEGIIRTPEEQRILIARGFGIIVCPHCWHMIDPNTCHCGQPMEHHGYQDGHSGVPMGCTCGYHEREKMKAKEPECPDYLKELGEIAEAIDQACEDLHSARIIANLKAAARKLRMWQEGVTEEDLFIPESERL